MGCTFVSKSHSETIRIGRLLGALLQPECVIGLTGDLGAGKTCFIKGIAYGMNGTPDEEVTSPTFTILQEYEGRLPLYHFDAYRLEGTADLETIGFEEYVGGDGVAVIEWADRIQAALPEGCLLMKIEVLDENSRRFSCEAAGELHAGILEALQKKMEEER